MREFVPRDQPRRTMRALVGDCTTAGGALSTLRIGLREAIEACNSATHRGAERPCVWIGVLTVLRRLHRDSLREQGGRIDHRVAKLFGTQADRLPQIDAFQKCIGKVGAGEICLRHTGAG